MPRKVFVAGEILTAADVNTNLMDQAVMVFDDSTARGSAIPSPSEGMVTYLKDINQVQAYDGSSFLPVGSILQVVSTTKTDTFTATSSAFVDVTGLSATITPSSTSSKVFILVNFLSGLNNADSLVRANLLRDSTNIAQSTGSSTADQTFAPFGNNANTGQTVSINFLDSPNTTSAVTYKIQVATPNAAHTIYVGRYANNDQYRSISSITVIEVAA